MEKHSISIDNDLYQEIAEYCKANNLKISQFCNDLIKNSFMVEKYGDIPFGSFEKVENPEPKEVIPEPIAPKIEPIAPKIEPKEVENEPIKENKVKETIQAPSKPVLRPQKRKLS